MPNGWSRPEAKTSLLLGLAAPSAARRTRIRPGSDSATKMSPFGATRTVRGSRRLEANSSTWKPGGTLGAAETGFATTRGGFDADRVAYGWGRSVILRRTKGAKCANHRMPPCRLIARRGYRRRVERKRLAQNTARRS